MLHAFPHILEHYLYFNSHLMITPTCWLAISVIHTIMYIINSVFLYQPGECANNIIDCNNTQASNIKFLILCDSLPSLFCIKRNAKHGIVRFCKCTVNDKYTVVWTQFNNTLYPCCTSHLSMISHWQSLQLNKKLLLL